jgi:hypothetical protein
MVGATEFSDALQRLEQAARSSEPAAAKEAAAEVDELWPDTRAAIEQLRAESPGGDSGGGPAGAEPPG